MKEFKGATAVITGGASGLGKEFALIGAELGMQLVLADIQQDALDATVSEFRARGVEAVGRRVDVSNAESVEALANVAIETFGKVNLLINNAGVAAGGLVWENSEQDWDWVLGVNLRGVVNGLRAFVPRMLDEASKDPAYQGHIINTSSMAGVLVLPAQGIYSVSKHAVVALSEALYHDLSLVTEQIHCSVLCPSYVPTNIGQSHRNRPESASGAAVLTKSQQAARDIAASSVQSGGMSARAVCDITFDAVRDEKFYVFPDNVAQAVMKQRFDNIVAHSNQPFVVDGLPMLNERRSHLLAALRR